MHLIPRALGWNFSVRVAGLLRSTLEDKNCHEAALQVQPHTLCVKRQANLAGLIFTYLKHAHLIQMFSEYVSLGRRNGERQTATCLCFVESCPGTGQNQRTAGLG